MSIKWEIISEQAVISLVAPPDNGLTSAVMESIMECLVNVRDEHDRPRVRSLLLQSQVPGVFSYGMDPHFFINADMDERKRLFVVLAELIEAFCKCGVPVIARLDGPAVAGGAVLALLADFVTIQQQGGKICFSETKVGLPMPSMIMKIIESKCGPRHLTDICLLAKNFDAEAAAQVGLAQNIHQNDQQAQDYVEQIHKRFCRLHPEVVQATLWELKHTLVKSKAPFLDSMEDTFTPFLSDEFLGKGLNALVKNNKLSW